MGPVSARIFVRTGREHADVFVRVCDVDGKGFRATSSTASGGSARRRVPAADVAVGDDGVLAVDVELYPTGYRLLAGHRIRVQVSGGAFPRFARNFGTGEPFATARRAVRCRFEIYHDAAHPSSVLLPVLAGA